MADVTIESIAIEITASAEKADKALKKLSENLAALKAVASGGLEGASKISEGLKEIAAGAAELQNVNGDKLKNVAEALKSLKSIGKIDNLQNAAKQMKHLRNIVSVVAGLPDIDPSRITAISKIANSVSKLGKVGQIPDLSGFTSQIQPLVSVASAISNTDMSTFAANMQQLAAGLQPLSGIQNRNFSSVVNALEKLPNVAKNISHMNLGSFARNIQQISAAIEPLSRQMRSLSSSFARLPEPVQQAVSSLINFNQQSQNTRTNTDSLSRSLKLLNFTAMYFAVRRVINVLGQFVKSSNDYVENLNLFTVTMGDAADEALDFANRVNSLMGIDVSEWIQNQGYFKQLVSGFGMVEEKANLVSKNMTQLGFDIASYFNLSVEDSMTKLRSGLAGELEPLRRIGYALDVATLQQVAYNHGIEMSINNMSQAQKAQLRYIAIMEQSKNAMGDMARTIDSPANQLRILESRIETLKRAIGDSLMPVISAALPYVTAFVQIVGEGFRALAEFMGFELPVFDYSDLISNGNGNITDSFDEATAAANKFKGTLSSIDQLNIIGSKSETAAKGNQFGTDLDLDLPSYDFLGNLKEETGQAYNAMKSFVTEIFPWVESLAAAWGAIFVSKKIGGFITGLSNLKTAFVNLAGKNAGDKLTKTLTGVAGGLAAGASSGILFYNSLKNIIAGTGNATHNWIKFGGAVAIAGGAIAAFAALGNPVGAVITGIVAGIGALVGALEGLNEQDQRALGGFLFNNGGTKISEIARAFEDWTNAAKKVNDEFINKYSKLNEYNTKMGELCTTMKEIAGVDLKLDEITPANAAVLKEPFDELCTYLKTDFQERVNLATQSVADAFKNLNLGESLNAEIQAAYKLMQREFDETITDSQKVVDKYLDKILQGSKLSSEEMTKFQDEFNFTFELSAQKDESLVNLQKALDEIDLSKIDLENESYGVESIEKIKSASEEYIKSAKERYDLELDNINEMRRELEILKKYGKITEGNYNSRMDLLTLSRDLFAMNLDKQVTDVKNKVGKITGTINQTLYEGSQTAQVNYGDWLGATFAGFDYKNLKEYAKSRVLNNSKIYSANQELDQASAFDWNATVEIHNTYATEETAQMWSYVLKENNPDLEVMIGRIQDETGQWKYVVGDVQSLIKANLQIRDESGNFAYITGEKTAQIKAYATVSMDEWYKPLSTVSSTGPYMLGQIDVKSQYDWAYKAGQWIEKGFKDGLSETQYQAYWKELADIGAETFCEKYGIHSPSTLFKSYGEYIMQGLSNGLDRGQTSVLSSLDSTTRAMEARMKGLEFSVPVYTAEDMNKMYNFNNYAPQITTRLPEYQGADPEAVSRTAQAWNANGKPIDVNVNVQSYVELDGDQVGEATTRYQQRQMAYSNGY